MEAVTTPDKANGAAQLPHPVQAPCECQGRGAKKRINQLVRHRFQLQAEIGELRLAIQKYEEMMTKYKAALSAARRKRGR